MNNTRISKTKLIQKEVPKSISGNKYVDAKVAMQMYQSTKYYPQYYMTQMNQNMYSYYIGSQ